MLTPHHAHLLRSILLCCLTAGSLAFAPRALTQDSSFLDCARFEDRGQRIACLEDALEAATGGEPQTAAAQSPVTETAPVAAQAPGSNDRTSLLERIGRFGQDEAETKISTDERGKERLHDSIAALEIRNNLWTITLTSGQIWRQTYPRTLQLREGDDIEIYQAGIGRGYRLATPRLSGFLRVERVQ